MESFLATRVYVKFLGSGEEARIRGAYGENYERLSVMSVVKEGRWELYYFFYLMSS